MKLIYYYAAFFLIVVAACTVACNSPMQSQKFFIKAVNDDPILEPIHKTALYTVFFDHALRRCVLHSSYTWGESGGGTGGTGLGVTVFNCNPQALKAHVENLRQQVDDGTEYFELPSPKIRKSTTPKRQNKPLQSAPATPKSSLNAPSVQPKTVAPPIATPTASPAPPSGATKPAATPSRTPPLNAAPQKANESPSAAPSNAGGAPKSPARSGSAPLQPIYQP